MTNCNSPEYARFREASERFRQAQRELADTFWDKRAPAGGAPGCAPRRTGSPPPSPAAQSVRGVVTAGTGVGVGP